MSAGDPMWTCEYCGATYYSNNRTRCQCPKALEEEEKNNKLRRYYGEELLLPLSSPKSQTLNQLYDEIFTDEVVQNKMDEISDEVQGKAYKKEKDFGSDMDGYAARERILKQLIAGPALDAYDDLHISFSFS